MSVYSVDANGKVVEPTEESQVQLFKELLELKELGNSYFKEATKLADLKSKENEENRNNLYSKSLNAYVDAISLCHTFSSSYSKNNQQKIDETKLSLYLNLSMVHLKMGQNNRVKWHCEKALEIDKKNVKAYYRKGIAEFEMKEYANARKDLMEAAKLEPQNREVRTALAKVQEIETKAKETKQAAFKKALEKAIDEDPIEYPSATPATPSEDGSTPALQRPVKQATIQTDKVNPVKELKTIEKNIKNMEESVNSLLKDDKIMDLDDVRNSLKYWKNPAYMKNLKMDEWMAITQQSQDVRKNLQNQAEQYKQFKADFINNVILHLDTMEREVQDIYNKAIPKIKELKERAMNIIVKIDAEALIPDMNIAVETVASSFGGKRSGSSNFKM